MSSGKKSGNQDNLVQTGVRKELSLVAGLKVLRFTRERAVGEGKSLFPGRNSLR